MTWGVFEKRPRSSRNHEHADKGIPRDLLEKARCVPSFPGEEKLAFIFGGNYGKGLVTCRTERLERSEFLAVGGGSVGWQIGGSFTDGCCCL